MDERYISTIDLGSSKTALTVARISGDDVQVLYYGERPSAGIKNSAVFNPQKASMPIRELIGEAEDQLKIKIMQVVVGLPRCDVRQEISRASVERSNPEESISVEEVESLKSIAQDSYPLEDPDREELYGAVAQSFSDDENFQLIESDIIGVISKKFDGHFKLFIGKKSSVRTIDKVFNDLGIAVARKYFTPDCVSKAVLTDDEMENGVALIDLGGGATSVTIHLGKILRFYSSIPFGGKSITSDIRSECSVSEHLAENIKLAYGACMPDRLVNLGEKIIQIEGDEFEGYKQIPVQYLSEIITCRTKEIIEAMLYEIQRSGLADNLRNGIVITGGGAGLANIANYIKELSGYNVRTGYPRRKFSAAECNEVFGTGAATSIGMVLAAKADALVNCIETAVQGSEAPAAEDPAGIAGEAFERAEKDIPEMEGSFVDRENGELFPEGTVPEEPKKPGRKKEAKSRTSGIPSIKVIWEKTLGGFVGGLYDNVDEEV